MFLEHYYIEFFPGLQNIDQMMGHPLHLLRTDLGRTDIHMFIYLHGICRQDFSVYGFCQRDGQFCLSHSCRPGQDHQWFLFILYYRHYFFLTLFILLSVVLGTVCCIDGDDQHQTLQFILWIGEINSIRISPVKQFFRDMDDTAASIVYIIIPSQKISLHQPL